MIEKKTVVDQIEITRSGHMQIRFGKLLVEDGKEIACQWHRTVIEPGADVDAQIEFVNSHLIDMGYPAIEDISQLKRHAEVAFTPEKVAKHKKLQGDNASSIK